MAEEEHTLGFLISIRTSEYTGETLARTITSALLAVLSEFTEIDVDYLGTIDEVEEES